MFPSFGWALFALLYTGALAANEAILEAQQHSNALYAEQLQRMIAEEDKAASIYQRRLEDDAISDAALLGLAELLLDQLQRWIELDLPFLIEERQSRIKDLRTMLYSSTADTVEKLRRIFEAYRIEAEYGFTIESYRAKLKKHDTQVADLLHIGRTILVYRTLDGRRYGVWDHYAQNWQSLTLGYRHQIKRAIDISKKIALPEIVLLPVQLRQTAAIHSDGLADLSTKLESKRRAPIETSPDSDATPTATPAYTPPPSQNLKQTVAELESLLNQKKQHAAALQSSYYRRLGHTKGLIAVIRDTATELQNMIGGSFMRLLLPHYRNALAPLLHDYQTLEIAHIISLQKLFMELYRAQAETGFFSSELILADGSLAKRTIFHIGSFSLLYDGQFLDYTASLGYPVVLSRTPNLLFSLIADNVPENKNAAFTKLPVDLSHGAALAKISASPSIADYIWRGGWVSLIIAVIAVYAFATALYKIFWLRQYWHAMNSKKGDAWLKLFKQDPIVNHKAAASLEKLEWAIERAMIEKIALLERGFSSIKITIIAAPLLGLLGTVLGMMESFQAISLFGSNDPKIMARGISHALITTAMGLCVAIPLLLLYNWALSYYKRIRNQLDMQNAELLAEQATKIEH